MDLAGRTDAADEEVRSAPVGAEDLDMQFPVERQDRIADLPAEAPGRPRRRPTKLHADKGYDYPAQRRALRRRGITARIARRGVESHERLGRHHWVVERTQAWLVGFRKLALRHDHQAATVLARLPLACTLICLRFLAHAEADLR